MDSVAWTLYCGRTGKSHENLIQCPDCQAINPQISHPVSSTSVRREVIDLSIDSPPSRTQSAVSVSAAPKFANYNHKNGAETLRQTRFSQRGPAVRSIRRQTVLPSSPAPVSYRAIVTFSLLMYELVQDLNQTVGYQILGMYD